MQPGVRPCNLRCPAARPANSPVRTESARPIAGPGKKVGDEGDPWGIREPEDFFHRPGAGCRGRRRPGLPGRGPLCAAARDRLGSATGHHHRRHLRRLGHRRRTPRRGAGHGPGGVALRGAHVTSGRRHPAAHPACRRGAAPHPVGPLAAATVEPPVPSADHAGRPAAPGLPARGGGHDAAPPGADRHLRAGPGPRRAHGQSLAGRAAHLHGPPVGRGPGRLRPRRRPSGAPGRSRAGLVRHPRLLPTGRHRGHRVRRRGRALGHQRGRAPVRGPRRGGRHLLHVGGPRQCQRGRRLAPADRAPAHGAGDRPAAGGRGRRDQPGARHVGRATPWGCAPWPRTGAPR